MTDTKPDAEKPATRKDKPEDKTSGSAMPKEIGGRKGPEPTRYGDWERNGIISDF